MQPVDPGRDVLRDDPLMLALPVALVAAALVPGTSGAPAAGFDFGDAPDGSPAGYVGKSVRGAFPSKAASGGPRHSAAGPRIGTRWSGETNSRQVDRDADDGAQLNLRACAVSTVSFVLDASRVPAGTPVYVNAWFDWNQDGDWAEGGNARCGPEWGIQNQRIDPASLGTARITGVTLRFRAGKVPQQLWWRLQVHVGDPAPHAGGGNQGTATAGETEDSFHGRLLPEPAPAFHPWCSPLVSLAAHGRSAVTWWGLTGEGRVVVADFRHSVAGDTAGVDVRWMRNGDRGSIIVLKSTRKHRTSRVIQALRVTLSLDVFVNGQRRTYTKSCRVYFFHAAPYAPAGPPPVVTTPAILGGGVDPIRPDPVKARCAARFTPIGYTLGAVGAQGGQIEVRCEEVDVRSISVSAGSGGQKISFVKWASDPEGGIGDCLPVTVNGVEWRAVQCLPLLPNKRTIVGFEYRTDSPFASTTVHVTAGGFSSGPGTTIVLRQQFTFPREGMVCSQTVPDARACATIP